MNNKKKDLKPLDRISYQGSPEIRKLVREHIIPEVIEAIKNHDFRDGLRQALGLKECK